jgi:hypothetical protein
MIAKVKGKYGFKFLSLPLSLLLILFCSMALSIPEAKGITVYQSFSNDGRLAGWSSYTDIWESSFTNFWIFFNYEPYHAAMPSLSPSGTQHSQPIGYLRKTFTNTNSTNFTWLNITAYYYVSNVINDQPNIMINLNNRLLFGDCYPSNNWTYQNNVLAVTVSKTGSVYSNFQSPNQFLQAQQGFNILHYKGAWHKLELTLAQTNVSYTLDYYYDDNIVLDSLTWPLAYFTTPLEVYDIKLYLGRNTWIDDIEMDYRYQTTPISTPYYSLWYLAYLFAPNDNPLIANKSYVLNMYSYYGGVGTPSLLSLTLEGTYIGNFTTDNAGVYSLAISFPTPGTYGILIEAYDSGALVKTLSSSFTVITAPSTSPPTGIPAFTWDLPTLLNMLVPAIVVSVVGYGVSTLFAQFDHGTAGFFVGTAMGLVVVANAGLIPMWFFSVCLIIGAVGVYYYMRS